MFVWRVDFIERHIMGSEKWEANAESGYAAEVYGDVRGRGTRRGCREVREP